MQPLQVGVCSWSLKMADLGDAFVTIRKALGLNLVQIGFWDESFKNTDRIIKLIERSGLEVSATCIGFEGEDYSSIQRIAETGGFKPDAEWPRRLAKTKDFADFTSAVGVKWLATHIGFVPHDTSDPKHAVMVDRLKQVCDVLARRDLILVMETGQERAESLMEFIDAVDRDNIRINFDPANMILYGVGDPLQAVEILKDKIVHCHMKDATWSKEPTKTWGEEVVLGTGQASIPKLVTKLRSLGYEGPLVIEREAGDQRVADIKEGIKLLERVVG
jgi:L-ribulose-5-phosphate 3-epimerase